MLEDASLEKDVMMAFEAFHAYISPQLYHLPVVVATGMLLFKTYYIAQLYLYNHGYQGSRGLRRQGGKIVIYLVFQFRRCTPCRLGEILLP